jgi:hypothetical protein
MKVTVFWDVAPCSLVKIDRRFRAAYCLHHQGDRQTTWCNIPDDSYLLSLVFHFLIYIKLYHLICESPVKCK